MSIKNDEVERLVDELGRLTGSSKTEVIRQALLEKKRRMAVLGSGDAATARGVRLSAFLTQRVWPTLPKGASRRWSKAEEERTLGYGAHGEPE